MSPWEPSEFSIFTHFLPNHHLIDYSRYQPLYQIYQGNNIANLSHHYQNRMGCEWHWFLRSDIRMEGQLDGRHNDANPHQGSSGLKSGFTFKQLNKWIFWCSVSLRKSYLYWQLSDHTENQSITFVCVHLEFLDFMMAERVVL